MRIEAGIVSTVAGSGQQGCLDGPALQATFNYPHDVQYDPKTDTVFVADFGNDKIRTIRKGIHICVL